MQLGCLFEKAAAVTVNFWMASLAISFSVYPGYCCLLHLCLQAVLIHGAGRRVQKWGILSVQDPLLACWKNSCSIFGKLQPSWTQGCHLLSPSQIHAGFGRPCQGLASSKDSRWGLCTSGPPRKLAKLSHSLNLCKRHQGVLRPRRITPKQEGTEDLVKDSGL